MQYQALITPTAEYKVQIISKEQSLWDKHKIKIVTATVISIVAIAAAVFYAQTSVPKPGCVEGFYDDWTNARCENGEWNPNFRIRNYERFKGLFEKCASSIIQMPGCFDGKYYRELTQECKDNPAAALCDGKYDYQEFVKDVYEWGCKMESL